MISMPHNSKSRVLRVATFAPRDLQIAAMSASDCEIGRPSRALLAVIAA
jgi:hypothetical protein